MFKKLLLFVAVTLSSLAQITPYLPDSNPSPDPTPPSSTQARVVQYLFSSYPQLRSSSKTLSGSINRTSNNRIKLQDYYFTFELNSSLISVFVTISQTSPCEFVSLSPLITTISNGNLTSTENENQNSNYNIISNHEVREANNHTSNSHSLGSFESFDNRTDPRLDCAFAFIDSLHPLMVDYRVESVYYQVVSGINFLMEYVGDDEFTKIRALVNIDLNMQPNLLAFFVHCNNSTNSTIALPCTNPLALQIFNANEALIITHPQLLSYELISMVSDDTQVSDGILFVLTFENVREKTRVMVEININGNIFSILAYYSYAYPQ